MLGRELKNLSVDFGNFTCAQVKLGEPLNTDFHEPNNRQNFIN